MKYRTYRRPVINKRKKPAPNPLRIDPTRTVTLRRQFSMQLKRRFAALRLAVVRLIADEDALGLKERPNPLAVNERWRFNTDPEKVKAFRRWLEEQIGRTITSESEEQLWRRYVEAGFRKGAARSFDDVNKAKQAARAKDREALDFYQGTKEEFLRSAFGRPVAVDKVKLLAGRSFDDLEGVTADMSLRMARVLTDGLVTGAGVRDIASSLSEEVDLGASRSLSIARTEIIRAHASGQLQALEDLGVEEVGVAVEWLTADDEAVCVRCDAMRGVVLKLEEAAGLIPLHPNCLPGDSLVLSRSRVAAASERLYDGDLVIFRTASGRELSCTPNHPVLTDGGWIAASLLDVGSNVVCDGGGEWQTGVNHDHKDVPARIEDVAKAVASSAVVATREVPTSAPDFHGDGAGSEVAVIWTNCELRLADDPSLGEHGLEQPFGVGSENVCHAFSGFGGLTKLSEGLEATSRSDVCGADLIGSLGTGHPGPLEQFGVTLTSPCDVGRLQSGHDSPTRNAEPLGNTLLGFTREVQGDDFLVRNQSQPAGPVLTREDSLDDLVRDAELAGNLSGGDAGPVFLDKVVSLRIEKFLGHVYNLQTDEGWYSANGIITHNCRCAFLPAGVGEDESGQTRTKSAIDRAIGKAQRGGKGEDGVEWGPGVSISKSRPKSILNEASPLLSFSRWLVENEGDNCGTGAGGFQPGNTCGGKGGTGGSAGASARPSKAKVEIVDQSPAGSQSQHAREATQHRETAAAYREHADAMQRTGIARNPGAIESVEDQISSYRGGQAHFERLASEADRRVSEAASSTHAEGREQIKKLFGDDPQSIASAVGAPDNATVRVSGTKYSATISVSHPEYSASRNAYIDADGKKVMSNAYFALHEGGKGEGLGSKVFGDQVANLREQGFDRINTSAAKGGGYNGYYTWARLGYDQKISDFDDAKVRGRIKATFPDAKSVQDILAVKDVKLSAQETAYVRRKAAALDRKVGRPVRSPEKITGADWWYARGAWMQNATFDLKDGSRSMQVHEGYLKEREARGKTRNSLAASPRRRRLGAGEPQGQVEEIEITAEEEAALDRVYYGTTENELAANDLSTGGNCGIGAGGFEPGNTCAKGDGSDKTKYVGKLVGAAEHAHADQVSNDLARQLGGKTEEHTSDKGQKDKKPYDVKVRKKGGGDHDIEVKSLLKGKKQVISVHKDALLRKVEHSQANPQNTFHTVVRDERATYEDGKYSENYSGHSLYYKRGSGRYALSKMHKVGSPAELKRLLDTPDDQLPEKARGSLPKGEVVKLREQAAKAAESRKTRDKARKERNRDKLREQARARREKMKAGAV